MSYIISYTGVKLKIKWYACDKYMAQWRFTNEKNKAYRYKSLEKAKAVLKHCKIQRDYDWKIEELGYD
ncbi:hypothetical protein Hs30E_15710 [Lactococcus hodotermopsidis]|uniref:Uncharacterized protein n=1 Tax=Pseudolactococcus hodotermopsidis TaxID=2709157 RepID=A0A6A0BCC6_9LACT|nr:hypothetical protein [Lactococcus hodotermopsidis]GFH43020.1 hypothetical protein Hs30E_15710 [Lactococcus hodotermopsidis]